MDLFTNLPDHRKSAVGKTEILYKQASSILTEAKGFMADYDYTLNPYSGCSFGCTYCYAAFFSRSQAQRERWGYWLQVKENALQLLTKRRKKPLSNVAIYMSSVTDPYQPIERELGITRSLLKELADFHQPRLVIQTRSPLCTRDIDIFRQFDAIQVNMTITTDSEDVRRVFEPLCPSNRSRLNAIREVQEAGIQACITMTPLLPVKNAQSFAQMLLDTGVKKFIIQPFHSDKGKFVASTREKAMQLIRDMEWTQEKYLHVLQIIRRYIPDVGEGKDGFKPI